MVSAVMRNMLEKEIARTEIHLAALYDILDQMEQESPKRKMPRDTQSRIPLIKKALEKVHGGRVFSVKEVTDFAQRIEPDVNRRLIYNCIKGYLQRSVERNEGLFEQVDINEYRRVDFEPLGTVSGVHTL